MDNLEPEEASEFVKGTLRALKGHIENKIPEGVRVESHMFHAALDEYGIILGNNKVAQFRNEYSTMMNKGGYDLIRPK